MRLPIRNYTGKPLNLFIEVLCDEYVIPISGEAIVTLPSGFPHSIDVHEGMVVIWDEGSTDTTPVEITNTMESLKPPRTQARAAPSKGAWWKFGR